MPTRAVIPRSSTRTLDHLNATLQFCWVVEPDTSPRFVDPALAWGDLHSHEAARLTEEQDGTYRVTVHTRLSYVLARSATSIPADHACEGPLTSTGDCAGCAREACAEGEGRKVGLPMPPVGVDAVAALRRHTHTDIGEIADCLVCALLDQVCPDCGKAARDMTDLQRSHHRLVRHRYVAVGCEDYLSPAARAAVLQETGVRA
jgi:hypothetical protein